MSHKAYKFQLYPSRSQAIKFNKTFGCVRVVWNDFVAQFNDPNACQIKFTTTDLRKRPDREYLLDASAAALQQKQMDWLEFKKQFFNKKRKTKVGRPKFKKRGKSKDVFRLPNQKIKVINTKIQVEKIGWVNIKGTPVPATSRVLNCTFSKDRAGRYWASVLVEEVIKQFPKTNKVVGVDLGLIDLIVKSDDTKVTNPKFRRKNQAKIKRIQQHMSRKVPKSRRFKHLQTKLNKAHQQVVNQRDWLYHNLSLQLVKEFDLICLEDLDIVSLLQKSSAVKAYNIADANWGRLVDMIKYKAAWYGKEVQLVDRFYPSTHICNCCGYKLDRKLKITEREWTCGVCGAQSDRDLNAAQNIRDEGLVLSHQAGRVGPELHTWMEINIDQLIEKSLVSKLSSSRSVDTLS